MELMNLILFITLSAINIYLSKKNEKKNLNSYKHYIQDCKNHHRYFKNIHKKNKSPYISICLPVLNMKKYIKQALLSIINQSFHDFQIIIINDNSKDNTYNILKKMSFEDNRIKIITHSIKKGVYYSRVEAILNANGKYIILMDPDDMFLNANLFLELYNYNLNYNLDIIEFTVFYQIEGRRNILYLNKHYYNHYHNFSKYIIYQPELSTLLFKVPNTNRYSRTICRNIWNKMIRKSVFIDMHNFIGIDYLNKYIITADDMLMNVISYHFANNYSNIDLPGYMYNIRDISMSHGGGFEIKTLRSINYYFYFRIFYKYIKLFKINLKSLFYEMKNLRRFIINFNSYNIISYQKELKDFLSEILNDKDTHLKFKILLSDVLLYLEEDHKNN